MIYGGQLGACFESRSMPSLSGMVWISLISAEAKIYTEFDCEYL